MKKAILIDAINRTVTETTIGIWSEIAPKIGCDLFDIIQLDAKNDLYVDDEGLLKNPKNFILWDGYPTPLAGNGLILGGDHNTGESCDTNLTVDQVKVKVKFLDLVEVIKGGY
jgi:hypothetical protein